MPTTRAAFVCPRARSNNSAFRCGLDAARTRVGPPSKIAICTLILMLVGAGCSSRNPSEPTPASPASGLLERRVGDVGGGQSGGTCPGETCGPITVELRGPDGSTFTFVCGGFPFDSPLPQSTDCEHDLEGEGTGRFEKFLVGETTTLTTVVTIRSTAVAIRLVLLIGGHGFLSDGELAVGELFRQRAPCVAGQPALRVHATGTLPHFGRVTAMITGTCPGPSG
jgi:hypothetical protein